ncbi:alpha/beta hydrolase [Ktedonosporobacter rubrisoli]|uniref:Alpha/beta hydrolase n=1 Tax=Ktedonosporobacter rubrisoli TaxID=2509675 RepID=A0A4P6K6S1_KTERU|nr:alpha/beta hydrolase [Ktedonosporobacter rubrisoli]
MFPGISSRSIQTARLEIAYLQAGTGNIPLVLIHGNCSSSLFFQSFMQALSATGRYIIYAPDMRGYGESAGAPVDATRGLRDFSDDIQAFVQALGLPPFHLFGWSLGGNVVMQYAQDYPGTLRSLTLQAPGSPFGFGGTRDVQGTPTWPDYAGSGGGTANPEFVRRLAQGDRSDDAFSPRATMNTFYFKPPFRVSPELEELYVSALLRMKVDPGNYPGDTESSEHWPNVAPGKLGVNNALSPRYLNQASFAHCSAKPPVLWIHGADDQIVSDTSMFDFGYLGQLGAVPGWPGAEIYPAQPMKAQIRYVLEAYKANGGAYSEVMLAECGHSPHIEKQDEVVGLFTAFVDTH